jgi:uncharacterized protein (DUF2384 family)
MVRALQVYKPRTAMDWLVGNDPFLDHARPIDVLVKHGAAPLIVALDAFESSATREALPGLPVRCGRRATGV